MADKVESTRNWPELAIGLYDKLTGRGAEITYSFENLEVLVPGGVEPDAGHAPWRLNGSVSIRTKEHS